MWQDFFNIFNILFGFILVLVLILLLRVIISRGKGIKCKFDERQIIVQGKGFRYAFFILLLFNVVGISMNSTLEQKEIADPRLIMITGVCISAGVYAVYCIWNEGYIGLNVDVKRMQIIFAVIGIINLGASIVNWKDGKIVENGKLTLYFSNIICAVVMFAVLAAVWLKKRKDRIDLEKDEE